MSTTALSAARSPAPSAFDRSRAIQWCVAVLTVLLVVSPLVPIFVQAFLDKPLYEDGKALTTANFVRLFTEEGLGGIVANTLYFAVLMTIVAQFFGAVMAIVIGRTNVPGRRWMGELLVWPLFVSHLVVAFGWFIMYGPSGYITLAFRSWLGVAPWNLYTLTGMGVVAGLSQAPLAYLMCLGAVTKADAQLEDAARIVGAGPFRALWKVTFPMMRPALIYSTALNFVVGIEMLSIPLLFGAPVHIETVTSFLYDKGINAAVRPDYGIVGAAAVVLLILVAGLIWLQGILTGRSGRFVTVRGKASRPSILDLGRWRWVAFGVVFAYVFFSIIVIFAGILLRAGVTFLTPLIPFWKLLTTQNFELILGHANYLRSIWNSIVIALVGGAIGTAFVALVTLVSLRSGFLLRRQLEYVALLPRSLPGIIAGLGFFYAVIAVPGFDAIRGTIWVLMAVFIMRYIPIGFGTLAPALVQLAEDLDKAGRISGADWWTTCTKIVLPLLRPALFSTFALLFIHFFKEYVTAVFLYQPGSEIMGTVMLQLWAQGDNGPVSALAAIQVVITALFVMTARRLLGVKIYG